MTCDELDAVAGELALGILTGPELGAAVEHVARCARCRALVEELSAAADPLVLLAPPAEPPAGFEERALATFGRRRPQWWTLAAAAAAIVVVVALGLALRPRGSATDEVTMRAADGRVVGDAYLHDGDPAWVFVAVPGWTTGAERPPYTVRLTLQDGVEHDLGTSDLDAGAGAWGTVIDVDASRVRAVSLVGPDGRVWCSGTR